MVSQSEKEQSVVLVKPDGVKRGLIGEIISRFEKAGLKMVACKMVWIDRKLATQHYGYDDSWFESVGEKVRQFYKEHGMDIEEDFGKLTNHQMGESVQQWNVDYLTEGPVLAMVFEGVDSIETVRKIVGGTEPKTALPGTIRGDYAHVSYGHADDKGIAIKNLIHASANPEDAEKEVSLWFSVDELYQYKNLHEKHTME